MVSHEDNMEMMHCLCAREVEQLQQNLKGYLVESEIIKKFVNTCGERKSATAIGNIQEYSLAVYDNYMSNLETVTDMARKFNIHLQVKPLKKTTTDLINYETPQRTFTDFLPWNNFRQQHANAHNLRLAAAAGDACSAGGVGVGERYNSILSVGERYNSIPSNGQPYTSSSAPALSPPATPLSPKANLKRDELIKIENLHLSRTGKSQTASRKVHFPPSPTKLQQHYPHELVSRNLNYFKVDREFSATIVYVESYENLIFYINYLDSPALFDLYTMAHLRQIQQPPTNKNEIFGISDDKDNILRAVVHREKSCGNESVEKSRDEMLKVLLIDFGEVLELNENTILYEVPLKFQNIPTQAIKCVLLGINEINDNGKQENLADVLRRNEFQKCKFRVVHNSGSVLQVLLLVQEENHSPKWQSMMTAVNESVKNLNPFIFPSEDEDDFKDYVEQTIKMSNSSSPFTSPQTSGSHVNAECTEESNVLLINDDKPSNCSSIATVNTLDSTDINDGSNLILTGTYAADVECFYAQIEKNPHEPLEQLLWSDDEVPVSHRLEQAPQLNDLILAKYNKDDFWYRAKVIEIYEENKYFKVFYVDYGNKEIVSLGSLAKCLCSQLEEPYRAVRCRLANITSITGSDEIRNTQALQTIRMFIVNQTFSVKVLHKSDSELLIQLVDEAFLEVPKMLINLGYAKESENQLFPDEPKGQRELKN